MSTSLAWSAHLESGVLHVRLRGRVMLDDACRVYDEVIRYAVDHARHVVFLDCRTLEGSLRDLERYEFAMHAVAHHAALVQAGGVSPRIAIAGAEPLIDPGRVGETVATNRGVWLKVTTSADDALAWLISPEDSRPVAAAAPDPAPPSAG
jgi:hypothetical protein